MLYDCDIPIIVLCADGPGPADLGEEGGQLMENKEQTGSWAVTREGSHKRQGDGTTSWCSKQPEVHARELSSCTCTTGTEHPSALFLCLTPPSLPQVRIAVFCHLPLLPDWALIFALK